MIDLAALRRNVDTAARTVDLERIADMVGIFEAGKAVALARLTAPEPSAPIARLVTAEELEAAHHVPATWFLAAARRGTIAAVRFGAHVRFDPASICAALADQPPLRRRTKMGCPSRPEKPSNGKARPAAATAAENRVEADRG